MPPIFTPHETHAVTSSRYWAVQHNNEISFDQLARFTVWVDEFNGISKPLRLIFSHRGDIYYELIVQKINTIVVFHVDIIRAPLGGYGLFVGLNPVRSLGSLIRQFITWSTQNRVVSSQKMVLPWGPMNEMALLQDSMSALHLRLNALEQHSLFK
jgi:hypothetical protein